MGMKIRQESKVRTFFKKFFRFPKKDKKWDRYENVEYKGSTLSIISAALFQSLENLQNTDKYEVAKLPMPTDQVDLDDSTEKENVLDISNTEERKKSKKNKKWKVKVDLKETKLVEVRKYDEIESLTTNSEISEDNRKAKKKKVPTATLR